MIKSFLIKLRQKPKHVRQQVSLGVAAAFTSVVAIFWLTSLPETVKVIGEATPAGANAFSSFTDKINEQIQSAKEMSKQISTTTASSTIKDTNLASVVATTTASSSVSLVPSTTTPTTYIREVRIATTTASTSQVNI
jgi:hypothetical protein